jgi:hypothetical protein
MGADRITWSPVARVDKFDADQTDWVRTKTGLKTPEHRHFVMNGIKPYAESVSEGNLLTTAGLTRLTALVIASGGLQALTNTATRLGVGNGAGTAAVGDTDMSASAGTSNRYYMTMDATYPSVAAGVITAKATFASADGNFAWNEWGLDIGAPTVSAGATVNACLFNHKTSAALGTKSAGQTWALTVTVTIA